MSMVTHATLTREEDILTGRLLPQLLNYLHVHDVKPHLLAARVITRNEYEQLQVGQSPQLTSEKAVAEKLLLLLSRKPDGASQLLRALKTSVEGDSPQLAHCQLIEDLTAALGHGDTSADGPFFPHMIQEPRHPRTNEG